MPNGFEEECKAQIARFGKLVEADLKQAEYWQGAKEACQELLQAHAKTCKLPDVATLVATARNEALAELKAAKAEAHNAGYIAGQARGKEEERARVLKAIQNEG